MQKMPNAIRDSCGIPPVKKTADQSEIFCTRIDTHVTVLVSAAILYQFGTGPVKGFAVSLAIGILASLFTAVFFTRLIFDLLYMGRRRLQTLSI